MFVAGVSLRLGLIHVLLSGSLGASTSPLPSGSYLRAEDARIAAIGFRLAVQGRRFCPRLEPASGLMLHHLGEYEGPNRLEAERLYGLSAGPGILTVVPGSPAAAAGLRAGDLLLGVNGHAFPAPGAALGEPDMQKRRRLMERADFMIGEALRPGPAELAIMRRGTRMTFKLAPVPGCPARVRLARSLQRNAFADGDYAILTTRLLGTIQSDDELAVTLAHEMAHNILGHADLLSKGGIPFGPAGRTRRHAPTILATELAADRLGLKLAWAAGYDIDAAIPFWRRLRNANLPSGRSLTHPSLGTRERLLRETKAELEGSEPRAQRPELGKSAFSQR